MVRLANNESTMNKPLNFNNRLVAINETRPFLFQNIYFPERSFKTLYKGFSLWRVES